MVADALRPVAMRKLGLVSGAVGRCVLMLIPLFAGAHAALGQMSLPGKFAVNVLGAATYGIPIAVPPGTAGMSPSLSLDYNSHSGDGIVGLGWSFSGLPAIGRCPKTVAQDGVRGAVKFNQQDRFCLDGQRLMAVSGAYGADGTEYRTEIDTYARIFSRGIYGDGPIWFEVDTKNGQTMEFGRTVDSRVVVQGQQAIRSWALSKVRDTKGNYFTVTYTNENGQAHPSQIDYTGNAVAALNPYNAVKFVYETRPDPTTIYQAGAEWRTTVRLTSIETYADTELVSQYNLTYRQSPSTSVSLLDSVRLCPAAGACLPATVPTWLDGDYGQFGAPIYSLIAENDKHTWTAAFADIDGDGKADAIAYRLNDTGWLVDVALSEGDGTFATAARRINAYPGSNLTGWGGPLRMSTVMEKLTQSPIASIKTVGERELPCRQATAHLGRRWVGPRRAPIIPVGMLLLPMSTEMGRLTRSPMQRTLPGFMPL